MTFIVGLVFILLGVYISYNEGFGINGVIPIVFGTIAVVVSRYATNRSGSSDHYDMDFDSSDFGSD